MHRVASSRRVVEHSVHLAVLQELQLACILQVKLRSIVLLPVYG